MGREWGEDGEGEVSLRATWGQSERDRITPKEGFQVSKREMEGELVRGVKRGIAPQRILSICICVYNNCMNAANNLMCLGYK
jgi:hypothetical protein